MSRLLTIGGKLVKRLTGLTNDCNCCCCQCQGILHEYVVDTPVTIDKILTVVDAIRAIGSTLPDGTGHRIACIKDCRGIPDITEPDANIDAASVFALTTCCTYPSIGNFDHCCDIPIGEGSQCTKLIQDIFFDNTPSVATYNEIGAQNCCCPSKELLACFFGDPLVAYNRVYYQAPPSCCCRGVPRFG